MTESDDLRTTGERRAQLAREVSGQIRQGLEHTFESMSDALRAQSRTLDKMATRDELQSLGDRVTSAVDRGNDRIAEKLDRLGDRLVDALAKAHSPQAAQPSQSHIQKKPDDTALRIPWPIVKWAVGIVGGSGILGAIWAFLEGKLGGK